MLDSEFYFVKNFRRKDLEGVDKEARIRRDSYPINGCVETELVEKAKRKNLELDTEMGNIQLTQENQYE